MSANAAWGMFSAREDGGGYQGESGTLPLSLLSMRSARDEDIPGSPHAQAGTSDVFAMLPPSSSPPPRSAPPISPRSQPAKAAPTNSPPSFPPRDASPQSARTAKAPRQVPAQAAASSARSHQQTPQQSQQQQQQRKPQQQQQQQRKPQQGQATPDAQSGFVSFASGRTDQPSSASPDRQVAHQCWVCYANFQSANALNNHVLNDHSQMAQQYKPGGTVPKSTQLKFV